MSDPDKVASDTQVADAPDAPKDSLDPDNANPLGLSGIIIYKVYVDGVHPKVDHKTMIKELNKRDIQPKKVKKGIGMPFAVLTFENEKDQHECLGKINGWKFKGQDVTARACEPEDSQERSNKRLREANEDGGRENKRHQSDKPAPTTAAEVVTPDVDVPYDEQLKRKRREMTGVLKSLKQTLSTECHKNKQPPPDWILKKAPPVPFEAVLESPNRSGFRNKCDFSVGLGADGKAVVGFMAGGLRDGKVNVLDSSECVHLTPEAVSVCHAFKAHVDANLHKVVPFDLMKRESGFWRLLSVRTTLTGEIMVMPQISDKYVEPSIIEEQRGLLVERFKAIPGVKSIYLQVYNGNTHMLNLEEPCQLLYGEPIIIEELLGLKFQISPLSFFQTNTKGASVLYAKIREWCAVQDGKSVVLDVCCGTGTIGLTMANVAKEVIGLEIVEDAVEDSKKNANLNNIQNARFIAGKAEQTIPSVLRNIPPSQDIVAVVDPPRAGLHNDCLLAIRRNSAIERLIYVSCNPTKSFVKDACTLCRNESKKMRGPPFRPVLSCAVDLFPHTKHCELVVLFERGKLLEETLAARDKQSAAAAASEAQVGNDSVAPIENDP